MRCIDQGISRIGKQRNETKKSESDAEMLVEERRKCRARKQCIEQGSIKADGKGGKQIE